MASRKWQASPLPFHVNAHDVARLLHTFILFPVLGITSTTCMATMYSQLKVCRLDAGQVLQLWRLCYCAGADSESMKTFNAQCRKAQQHRSSMLSRVSDDVHTSLLPDGMSMSDAITILDGMTGSKFQTVLKANTKQKAKILNEDQAPWRKVACDVPCLDALATVALGILSCDTGFLDLSTVVEMVRSVYAEHKATCSWLRRPKELLSQLMRYLPVTSVRFYAAKSGQKTVFKVAARPPNGHQFLKQVQTLASVANINANATQNTLKALPMASYLMTLETERDRRAFKGLVVAVTNPTFARSTFNWKHASIGKISEDLELVDVYLADVQQLISSVEYCNTVSPAVRKRMRREAMVRLSLAGFLGKKRGGRPSKIEQYSC